MITVSHIKEQLNIIDIASQYTELTKEGNHYKATINPLRDEKTSSLVIYPSTKKYYDFGSSEGGDVIDFITKVEDITVVDVLKRYDDLYVEHNPNKIKEDSWLHNREPNKKEKPTEPTPSKTREQIEREFARFEPIDIYNLDHKRELSQTVEGYLYRDATPKRQEIFSSLLGYDVMNKTIVMKWCEYSIKNYNMVTYKRRRLNGAKWVNAKGTKPNKTIMNYITEPNEPIYIIEGARDALTALLGGLNFVAIPTTSFSNIEALKHILIESDKLIWICEDAQGYKAMQRLRDGLGFGGELITFSEDVDTKIDLTDYSQRFDNLESFLDGGI